MENNNYLFYYRIMFCQYKPLWLILSRVYSNTCWLDVGQMNNETTWTL